MSRYPLRAPVYRERTILNIGADGYQASFDARAYLPKQTQTFPTIATAQAWLNTLEDWLDRTYGMPD
jgi:hypothetical protein